MGRGVSRAALIALPVVAAMLGVAASRLGAVRAQLSRLGPSWENLHPEVKRRALAVLREANRVFNPRGLWVGVFEGWRTEARQRQVMQRGTSGVRDWRYSYHPWGLAVDFVFLDRLGRWTWDRPRSDWDELGRIIEAQGFEWGGRWRSFDGPHAQLPLLKPSQLIAEYGAPDLYLESIA